MEAIEKQKLTEDQKLTVLNVLDEFFMEFFPDLKKESKDLTEYDLLMKRKKEKFKKFLVQDDEPDQLNYIMEVCENIQEEMNIPDNNDFSSRFSLLIMYEMWLNECSFWPVSNPDLWKKWEKLKKIKVERIK